MSDRLPLSCSSCFGRLLRLSGHIRVPSPPARMATWVSAGTARPAPLAGSGIEELERPGESVVQRHGRPPAELFPSQAGIEDDAHDVAFARRPEVGLMRVARDFGHRLKDATDRRFATSADVEGHARAALE